MARRAQQWTGRGHVGLVEALLHVALEHVPALELTAAQLAGVGRGDAALVALVAHQRGLVEI